jgi:hypothetical protein
MPEEKTAEHHGLTASVEHMEEEIRALEGEASGRRWLLWLLGLALVAAIVAGAFYFSRGLESPRPQAMVGAEGGVPIELDQPRPGSRLTSPPTSFSWEPVSGRHDYLFRIVPEGGSEPLVERSVRNSSTQLSPEEAKLLAAGRTYVWTVTARRKDGTVIGSGQARFRLD